MARWSTVLALALVGCSNDISVSDVSGPPTAEIIVPVDGTVFDPLQPLTFCAQIGGNDDTVSLASSVDGVLATGDSFTTCDGGNTGVELFLTAADHTLELTVTDFRGRQARDSVRIEVAPNAAPTCSIALPITDTIVPEGEAVRFEAEVADLDGDPLELTLVSDLDGTLPVSGPAAGGAVLETLDGLSVGLHTLALTATDPRGELALCVTRVEVVDCLDDDGDGVSTCDGDCDDSDPEVYPGAPERPNGIDDDCDGTTDEDTELYDDDGDGFSELGGDCDDTDADVNPDAVETLDDGIDQDCSGADSVTCYDDADRDTFGSMGVVAGEGDCYAPGLSQTDDDCDDTDADAYPGAPEVLNDGIDQDCDGVDAVGCYADADSDGYGDEGVVLASPDGDCDDPLETATGGDCDDSDPAVNPAAYDVPGDGVDQDCSGVDAGTCYEDLDGDGFGGTTALTALDGDCVALGASEVDTDCDDDDALAFPGASEVPDDGIDQDCNGLDSVTCFVDADFDGFGGTTEQVAPDGDCTDPGESELDTDCDDTRATVFPGAPEVPDDGVDQDCSTEDTVSCFADIDQDGVGAAVIVLAADGTCDTADQEATVAGDCDDGDGATYPGAPETADDGIDQDCNGFDSVTCYADGDLDGYGAGPAQTNGLGLCNPALGESATDDDCDDADPTVYPGAPEVIADGIDQDCDTLDLVGCFEDLDGDGDGSAVVIPAPDGDCDDPGESSTQTDCDDTDPERSGLTTEVADDGIDQDCSGADTITCVADVDLDGFGGATTVLAPDGACDDPGEATTATDCDDADPTRYPGAPEVADDGVDQDCTGIDATTCFADADGDGFGTATTVVALDGACDDLGESATDDDCDDTAGTRFPGAPEVAGDGIDQDCNGTDTITCFEDEDQDGFGTAALVLAADGSCDAVDQESTLSTDCVDTDPTILPGAYDTPDDGIDQDCSGDDTVTCQVDVDLDGFGVGTPVLAADGDCSDPGESTTTDDCDDSDPAIYPGAPESVGDGIDQDCSGADSTDCFADTDADGFGSTSTVTSADADCTDPGEAPTSGDCDDTDPGIYTGAPEVADDGIDQDCSGTDTITCFLDGDLDGFAGDDTTLAADGDCLDLGEGAVVEDCDDTDPGIQPLASDVPDDTIDQDCNGVDATTCFVDGDFDGVGTATLVTALDGACDDPGESLASNDCDDTKGTIFPGAPEVADDGIDQDCSGTDTVTCQIDADLDGVGGPLTALQADGDCDDNGEALTSNDCDDADPDRYPGAPEIAGNGVDEDCDGSDTVVCYLDGDNDGYGTLAGTTVDASDGDCLDVGESASADDCDDGDPGIHPGVTDLFGNGIDENCDGTDGADSDLDGYAADYSGGPDCDDTDPDVNPGVAETRDGVDEDCDGLCDEGLVLAGDLVLTELMINPAAVGDSVGEWFEVKNVTGVDLPLCDAWTFSDLGGNSFTVADPDVVVPAGGYAVFAVEASPLANGGVSPDAVYPYASAGGMQLGQSGDELIITFDGLEIDAFLWGSSFDPTGASMQVATGLEDAVSNDDEASWCQATTPLSGGDAGTPGAAPDCP